MRFLQASFLLALVCMSYVESAPIRTRELWEDVLEKAYARADDYLPMAYKYAVQLKREAESIEKASKVAEPDPKEELMSALNNLLMTSADGFVDAFKAVFDNYEFYNKQAEYFLRGSMSETMNLTNIDEFEKGMATVRKMFLDMLESEFYDELPTFEEDFKKRFMEQNKVKKMLEFMHEADGKKPVKKLPAAANEAAQDMDEEKIKTFIEGMLEKETDILWELMEKRFIDDAKTKNITNQLLSEIQIGASRKAGEDVTLETVSANYWAGTEECIKSSEAAYLSILKANFEAAEDFKDIVGRIVKGIKRHNGGGSKGGKGEGEVA